MYPKDVMQTILANPASTPAGMPADIGNGINVTQKRRSSFEHEIEAWMLAHEQEHKGVHSYLDFLRRARAFFEQVHQNMGSFNPDATHSLGHDRWTVGWAGQSLLSIASYLYVLKSYGVEGCVLECGVFKGSSTACLSWVCRELGLKLYAADSFAGLPSGEGHYGAGDFRGSLEEVRANVERHGCPESVEYIPGWYAESLKGFEHPIALLWVDVDLQESVMDVLKNVFSRLVKNGVIFSDGFTEGVDFDGFKIRHTGGEPAGFVRFFDGNLINYQAVPGGAKGLALIVPYCRDDERVIFTADGFQYLLSKL